MKNQLADAYTSLCNTSCSHSARPMCQARCQELFSLIVILCPSPKPPAGQPRHDHVPRKSMGFQRGFACGCPALHSPPLLSAESQLRAGNGNTLVMFCFFSRQQPNPFSLADSGLRELSGILIRFQNGKECLYHTQHCQHHLINRLCTSTQARWTVSHAPGKRVQAGGQDASLLAGASATNSPRRSLQLGCQEEEMGPLWEKAPGVPDTQHVGGSSRAPSKCG